MNQPSSLRDFRNFLYLVWKHLRLPNPTERQYEIAQFLQQSYEDPENTRSFIAGFRGIGKSYVTSAFVLWLLYWNPQLNVVIRSAAKPRADAFTFFVLQLLDEFPLVAHLRPRDGQRRSLEKFDVAPAGNAQTPSVMSIGLFGSVTGFRGDVCIDDDIEVPNNSETVTQREKVRERQKEVEHLLKPGGKIIGLGTPQSDESVYNELHTLGYRLMVIPVRYPDKDLLAFYGSRSMRLPEKLLKELEADPSLVGTTTEPRFSDKWLAQKEVSVGPATFALQYNLDTRKSDAALHPLKMHDLLSFPLDGEMAPDRLVYRATPEALDKELDNFLVGLHGDRIYHAYHPPLPDQPNPTYIPWAETVLAIDPSGGGKDETAYAVVSSHNSQVWVRDVGGFVGMDETLAFRLAEIAKQYKVNRIVVETNYGGKMFPTLLKPALEKIHPCTIDEDFKVSKQKERRIIDILWPVMAAHRLVVDRGLFTRDYRSTENRSVEDRNKYRLFYQLTHITKERGSLDHEDRLDALSMAVAYFTDRVGVDVERSAAENLLQARIREIDDFKRNNLASLLTGSRNSPKGRSVIENLI